MELRDAVIKAAKRVEKRDGKKPVESAPPPVIEKAAPSKESVMETALAADAAAPKPQEPRQPTVEDLWPTTDKPDSSKPPV